MSPEQAKPFYGDEYPAKLKVWDGFLPLTEESRFTRYYSKKGQSTHIISRFSDGSATMTASQLEQEWGSWSEAERLDFTGSACDLHQQEDFPAILRFIMEHGSENECAAVALSIAAHIPRDEAYEFLLRAYRQSESRMGQNFLQAIAATKHPGAEGLIRKQLDEKWTHRKLWRYHPFCNDVAYSAQSCIVHLIELGASPSEFEDKVHRLADHKCRLIRETCRNFLGKYYSWLREI